MNDSLRALLALPDHELQATLTGLLDEYAEDTDEPWERVSAFEFQLETFGGMLDERIAQQAPPQRALSPEQQTLLDKAYDGLQRARTERPEDGLMGEDWRLSRLGEWQLITTYEWRPVHLLKLVSWAERLRLCGFDAAQVTAPLRPKISVLASLREAAEIELAKLHDFARDQTSTGYLRDGRILSTPPYLEWEEKDVPKTVHRVRIGGGGRGDNREPSQWEERVEYDEGFREHQKVLVARMKDLRASCEQQYLAKEQAAPAEVLLRLYFERTSEPSIMSQSAAVPAFASPKAPSEFPFLHFEPVYVEDLLPRAG